MGCDVQIIESKSLLLIQTQFYKNIAYTHVCSMEEEQDSHLCIETDSDTADKKDGTKCTVKWTQEEVSEKRTFKYNTIIFIF